MENAEPIGVEQLAKHMSEHNMPYSQGVIKGILTDMVSCIKELMLMGQPVKLADLAIFKATGEMKQKQLTEEGLLAFTSLAEEIRAGRASLKTKPVTQEP